MERKIPEPAKIMSPQLHDEQITTGLRSYRSKDQKKDFYLFLAPELSRPPPSSFLGASNPNITLQIRSINQIAEGK